MSITDKLAKTTGKITGKTFKIVKNAPNKTASKSKSLKDAFVDGVKSSSNWKKKGLTTQLQITLFTIIT